jgi:hypothetical protein
MPGFLGYVGVGTRSEAVFGPGRVRRMTESMSLLERWIVTWQRELLSRRVAQGATLANHGPRSEESREVVLLGS